MTGASIHTVLKLLVDIGTVCRDYQDAHLSEPTCRLIQCDETWSFCYAKDRNLPAEMRGKPGVGSIWTWVAIDADTKLVPCWRLGARDAGEAYEFMLDLESRLAPRYNSPPMATAPISLRSAGALGSTGHRLCPTG